MDRLEQIFENKRKSSEQFRGVQATHGMISTPELMRADPATREGTIELHKGIHWINLELAEFMGASAEDRLEELADVMHFLVELSLLAGFDHTLVPEDPRRVDPMSNFSEDRLSYCLNASKDDPFVFDDPHTNARFMMIACLQIAELLKNKPWKQTLKPPPDPEKFKTRFSGVWFWFGAVIRTDGWEAQDIFDKFVYKEKINFERIATGV